MLQSLRIAFVFLASFAASSVSAAWRAEGPALGNVSRIAIAPSKPDVVYAATSGGGVWRSDDGGKSWSLPGDEMTSRNVEWIVVEPNNPASVWVGTGTGSGSIWRSGDSGATWKVLGGSYPGGLLRPVGYPVVFVPAQPKTIFLPSTNLHYRSDDGGKTWRDFRVPNQDAYVFAVDPRDAKIVYAGGRGDSLNLSRSTDGGKTWRQTGIGLGKNSLRTLLIDPSNPTTLYAAGGVFTSVFKSTDSGDNWTELKLPVGGTSDLYELSMDPQDGNTLWAATEDGLLVSRNGGDSWQISDQGMGNYLAKSVAFDPRNSQHLIAGTGGTGVYASNDGGDSWSQSSRGFSGGNVTQIWGAPGNPLLHVQLSIGLFSADAQGPWSEIIEPFARGRSAELSGILFDSFSPQSAYAFDGAYLWKSSDGGMQWQFVAQKEPSMRDMMKGNMETVQFASLAQDRGDAKVFYAGSRSNDGPGGAVYKTSNGGKTWAPSGNGVPSERVGMLRAGASGVVLAVVDGRTLYRTADGGKTWMAAGGLPSARIYTVAVDDGEPSRAFAATEKGLFRTTDSGANWSRVSGGLEDDDIAAVVVDTASNAVFAGSFHGVFRSTDGGTSFQPMREGLSNQDVRALAIAGQPARLWAGTNGGGVFSSEIP